MTEAQQFTQALLEQARAAASALGHPRIARVCLDRPQASADRDAEFGLVVLDNGAAGLYYAWLGGEQATLAQRIGSADLEGAPAIQVAALLAEDSDIARSLGIATLNALCSALYARADFVQPAADDSFGGLKLEQKDRLGMIGNFPPLVRRARGLDVAVCVVERKQHMVRQEPGLTVSLDPAVLSGCNKIICTGATLLNNSFVDMLGYCRQAEEVVLIGPTVGLFPDEIFKRGVAAMAGSEITDGMRAYAALSSGHKLGTLARRTLLRPADYPGFAQLIAALNP